MANIDHSIVVNATREAAFGYFTDLAAMRRVWLSLMEIEQVRRLPNGGFLTTWVYRLGGVPFKGETETTEWIPPRRVVYASRGPMGSEAVATLTFETEAEGTRVTYAVDYSLPIPLLGSVLAELLQRQLDAEAEWIFRSMKSTLESPATS